MELQEFTALIPGFAKLPHPDRILHFGWYLHTQGGKEFFNQSDIRARYKAHHLNEPNFSEQFKRLLARRPKVLLADKAGYRLEHKAREQLDEKYGQHETRIALSKLLKDLPGRISDQAEKLFLSEAIICYHNRAFRAAIVMAWNLTSDHVLHWILADAQRLGAFSNCTAARIGPKRAAVMTIAKREDFEELKESETLDICGSAGLFPSINTKKILEIQLTKRNMAAHPSLVVMGAPEAEDTISSLVNNIVLALT
jgi:hypothetical protein